MSTLAVIQARMGSTRLPGKVLADIGGRSMLGRVCDRVRRAETIDRCVVATSEAPADRAIVEACRRLDVGCFCGSEHDVLDRFQQAAVYHGADVIVRITADCPLIDPEVTDRVVRAYLSRRPDYASNTLVRTWPRGLDTEVMTAAALARAAREATEPYQRAHVTPYLYQHPQRFRLLAVRDRDDASEHRWTVDTPEDLEFVRNVYDRLGRDCVFSWRDALGLLADEPGLAALNRHVRQKQLVEG
jgi:spore coat polysaccharide biosynthesis protein SpsF